MGNSSSKGTGAPQFPADHRDESSHDPQQGEPSGSSNGQEGRPQLYSSRHGRSSRSELSALFGIRQEHERERDVSSLETRREAKAEREARRAERERVAREAERERSMREEHVDGGYLVTQGVYTGVEDYSKQIVRQLMVCFHPLFCEIGSHPS